MSKDFENNDLNNEANSFGLPDGYFNHSAHNIMNKIEWLEEHKPYENLSKLKGLHGFITPANYFEKNESQLELIEFPALLAASRKNPFTVPQNYFEDAEVREMLVCQVGGIINEENELAGFDVLGRLEKKNSFVVSEGYFETSQKRIEKELTGGATVIPLFRANFWYSAAAAALVLTIGIWLYTQYFKPAGKDCGSLACIDKSELLKTKNIDNIDSDELFDIVDTKKLQESLDKKEEAKDKKDEKDSLSGVTADDLPDDI